MCRVQQVHSGRRIVILSLRRWLRHVFPALQEKLQGLASAPSLLIMGGVDEFVPSTVDKDLLVKRMAAAVGAGCKGVVVPSGKHNLKGSEQEVVKLVADFLSGLQT